MKALVGSLATAALLCLFIVVQSSLAVPNDLFCDGPWNGCGSTEFCILEIGRCTGGPGYAAYDQVGSDETGCAQSSEVSCYDDINTSVCMYKYYAKWNDGVCSQVINPCGPSSLSANVCE
jgi:hypothetical protein